ncbi:cytidylate kinase-like family protein [Candidatus Sumerlaeota bacterium]|nr:cytidylate kinase-like family protein [Candidatus Sumerlaeota bacterium]
MRSIEQLIGKQIGTWDRERGDWYPTPSLTQRKTRRRPAIALCAEFGCGARRVCNLLHRQSGYEIYGYRLIDKIAENMHARRMLIDRLDQRRRSYIRNLIEGLLSGRHIDGTEYFRHLVQVLRVFILEGGCILLGRGATFIVEPGAGIRVSLVAPRQQRIQNLMDYYRIGSDEAEERIETSDRERAEFSQAYFGADAHDPNHYDLTVNMERVSPETAATVIVRALEVMSTGRPEAEIRHGERPDPRDLVERKIEKWETEKTGENQLDIWGDSEDAKVRTGRLPAIAFSPAFCSGSRHVSEFLHSRLGYEVFGYGTLDQVAEDQELSPRIVERLDPQAKSALASLLDGLLEGKRAKRDDRFKALVETSRALILQGGVILLGRESTFLVQKDEGLRIRLTAPFEKRLENMKQFYNLEDKAARERLQQGDRDRADFARKYYKADLGDPKNFDLTINMERMTPDAAAAIALRALEPWLV